MNYETHYQTQRASRRAEAEAEFDELICRPDTPDTPELTYLQPYVYPLLRIVDYPARVDAWSAHSIAAMHITELAQGGKTVVTWFGHPHPFNRDQRQLHFLGERPASYSPVTY